MPVESQLSDAERPAKLAKLSSEEGKEERLVCEYLIPKKNYRRCHLTRKSGEKFCPQHKMDIDGDQSGRKRICCPKDPAHTIWEDQLEKHVKKCRTNDKSLPEAEWCVADYNIEKDTRTSDSSASISQSTIIDIVEKIYQHEFPGSYPAASHKESPGVESRLEELGNKKHALQQGSLIGNMVNEQFFSKPCLVVEFGAGRGELSRYIAKSRAKQLAQDQQESRYIMVDRSSPKLKFDTKIAKDWKEVNSGLDQFQPVVERIKLDITHLKLDAYPMIQQHPNHNLVAVSKHLCGCATDLTLNCLANMNHRADGILIALCCRQLCTWDAYSKPGREFLEKYGISKQSFPVLIKLTSWAVCGKRPDMDEEEYKWKESIGLKARAIIDKGRILGLEKQNWKARVVEYVDKQITLENHALIATR